MKKFKGMIGVMTLIFCITAVNCSACVTVNNQNNTYTVDGNGCVDY